MGQKKIAKFHSICLSRLSIKRRLALEHWRSRNIPLNEAPDLAHYRGVDWLDQLEMSLKVLRLAQQSASAMKASDVPPSEWNRVLQFLRVMTGASAMPSEDEIFGPTSTDDESRH